MKLKRLLWATIMGAILSLAAVATASAHEDHSTDDWPMTCVDLNDIVEEHLGNPHNVGIYQNTLGDQAEAACQNDHRNDVIAVFGWAIGTETVRQAEATDLELDWPTTCVELNDIVEGHLGNQGNVAIYQNTFGNQAEAACQTDHRNDVRSVFAWAIGPTAIAPPADLAQLTHNSDRDSYPVWSPDGRRIAFASERDGDYEIYLMNSDGSGVTRLTQSAGDDIAPDWSPDGRRIAFASQRDGDYEIYLMNADGSGVTPLTHSAGQDIAPAWSPDGRRIAFASSRDGGYEIYLINADGTGLTQLTDNSDWELDVAWSPDGRRIAFGARRHRDWDVYIMNADGSGVVNLTDDFDQRTTGHVYPAWSPDGRRIAFHAHSDGDWEIYIINADGTGLWQLTHNSVGDANPDWSPDGRRIAFASERDGDWEVYIMTPTLRN